MSGIADDSSQPPLITLLTAVPMAEEILLSRARPSISVKIPAIRIINPAYSTNPAPGRAGRRWLCG